MRRRGWESDARLDALIQEDIQRSTGVLEPDQPTEYSHMVAMEKYRHESSGEFTARERHDIRLALGLGPFAPSERP